MFESRRDGGLVELRIIARFGFCRGNAPDRLRQSLVVEPVDPFERSELDRLEIAPWSTPPDDLGLVKPINRLGERVVIPVADATDGRLDARFFQALRVFDRDILGGFNRSSQRSHWRR